MSALSALSAYTVLSETLDIYYIQSNLNSSDTDGSFTMINSNSFLSPYEILPIAQENKYWGKFSYFIMKLYVVYTHLMSTQLAFYVNLHRAVSYPDGPMTARYRFTQNADWVYTTYNYCVENQKDFPKLSHLLPDLALWLTLSSNNPYLEPVFMVPRLLEPLRFGCMFNALVLQRKSIRQNYFA